jgi:sulfur relay (sulfurtransferase) DsrC/TusE family protein
MSFLVLIFNVLNFVQITNRFFVQSFTNKKKNKKLATYYYIVHVRKTWHAYQNIPSRRQLCQNIWKEKKKKKKKSRKLKRNKKRGLPQQLRTQGQDVILLKTRLGQSKVPLCLSALSFQARTTKLVASYGLGGVLG